MLQATVDSRQFVLTGVTIHNNSVTGSVYNRGSMIV